MAYDDKIFLMQEYHHLKIGWDDILSATENFSPNRQIGKGGFGKVYKGRLSLPEGDLDVAIKRADPEFGQGDIEFWREIMMLSRYKHENLVTLLNFCFHGDNRILVYDFASRGSLDRHLRNTSLKWLQRLKICLGVAKGLNYLHNPNEGTHRVLHRDIKSANILLDEEWNAKISDFGLSKFSPANISKTFQISSTVVGSYGYMDPSYIEPRLLSKETDVYSFGVVLFEVMCGRLCYEYRDGDHHSLVGGWTKCFEEKNLDDIICRHLKTEMNGDSLKTFSTIAYQCLHRNPKERPNMVEVVQKLEDAIEQQVGPQSHRIGVYATRELMRWVAEVRKRRSSRSKAMSIWRCNSTSKCR